jgi:transposase
MPAMTLTDLQKGKVERAIRYVRESFFEGTRFTTLEDLNRRAWPYVIAEVLRQVIRRDKRFKNGQVATTPAAVRKAAGA